MSSSEKASSQDHKIEDVEHAPAQSVPLDAHYDEKFVKKTLRMLDWRMLPLLGGIYAVALIDRGNMGVARIAGMEVDLKLNIGDRFSIASMIYFIPYILLQVPANIVLTILGAKVWLTICVTGWGIAQTGMGFVPNWGLLVLCRVLLGVFEAGYFPALAFIITTWYKRHEVQQRLAIFYLTSMVIGAFSNIFAYGVILLAGKRNLNGWQWLFIIEGVITILLGVVAWLYIPDFPTTAKFVTAEQRQMVLDRVEEDRKDSVPDEITKAKVIHHMKDPMMWLYAYLFLAATVPAYAIGYFTPVILSSMGYKLKEVMLLSAPPGIFGAMSVFFFARISDRTQLRAPWLGVQSLFIIIGLAVIGFAEKNAPRYFGIFLAGAGCSGCVPGVLAYASNNITSHSRRAVQTAVIVSSGGIGGIMATTVFQQKDYPRYATGMYIAIGLQIGGLFVLSFLTFYLGRRNRLRREGKIGLLEGTEGFYYTL